jgi:hypothetical protein
MGCRVAHQPEPRYFTREEAEALLPELDRLLATAQELVARLEHMQPREEHAHHTNGQVLGRSEPSAAAEAEQHDIQRRLGGIVDQVQQQGVIVRDVRSGLIDFLARREGRDIFLCWRRGEALHLEWWHPVETGIAGRQRL